MLISSFLTSKESEMTISNRVMCRDIREIGASFSIKTNNISEFGRVSRQLTSVYDRSGADLPKSDQKALILSLYLVYLLTEHNFTEYNVRYSLAKRVTGPSEFIEYAGKLAQAVSDSSFTTIFQLQGKMPSPLFQSFANALLDGAREAHAKAIRKVYGQVTITDLIEILHFNEKDQAVRFIKQNNWGVGVDGETIVFPENEEKGKGVLDKASRYIGLAVTVSSLQ
jgi:hypothetical protein